MSLIHYNAFSAISVNATSNAQIIYFFKYIFNNKKKLSQDIINNK